MSSLGSADNGTNTKMLAVLWGMLSLAASDDSSCALSSLVLSDVSDDICSGLETK